MNAALHQEPLTRSVEDYLKVIYRLSRNGQTASTSDIAQHLELTAPSVSGMVKRLSEQKLLEHVPYKGVVLTDEGRRVALRMLRRHRIIEAYLVGFLGYAWDDVHQEAERLEHAVSEGLIGRMADALGNPSHDPHGDPIPDADLFISELEYTPLCEIQPGELVQVRRVDTSEAERLRYIASFGLLPGTLVQLIDRQPFQGPITIRTGEHQHVIGHEIAMLLLCSRAEGRP
ncbi:MAG: metal-dependent transcriptional regulator [Gemmatimonadota bacterium]